MAALGGSVSFSGRVVRAESISPSAFAPRGILAASCALSALCLYQVWFCFLATGNASLFYFEGPTSPAQFAALLVDTLALTVLFAGMWRLARPMRTSRAGEIFTDLGLFLFLAIPANAIRGVFQPVTAKLNLAYWRHAAVAGFPTRISAYGVVAVLLGVSIGFHRQITRFLSRILLFLFPLVPFMLVQASWVVAHARAPGVSLPLRPPALSATRPMQRVVWIIFDEMDYRLAFESTTNPKLTEFNRLAAESLHASHAFPPGGRTMISIPALLSGRLVTASNAVGVSALNVRYEGSPASVRLTTADTVLGLEREKGWRAGVAGWYFPYERLFGGDVHDAWQSQTYRLALNPNRPFLNLAADELRVLAEGKAQSLLGKSLTVEEHQRLVHGVVAEAVCKASDPRLDLVFLHLPVPHAPFYYDARTGGETARPRPVVGYPDHLQLGDHVLGQIRRAMNDSRVDGKTVLLISSDHWNREADVLDGRIDHRIPFIVHFPENRQGVTYNAPFNTVLSRQLVTAILEGEVRSATQAAHWIDREKGSLAESPYNKN